MIYYIIQENIIYIRAINKVRSKMQIQNYVKRELIK